MQENHSFDNYFGWYPGAEGLRSAPSTVAVKLFRASNNSFDPCHTVNCMASYYDGGKMDGFPYYGYFAASDISYYWHLASQGVLFDNYFSDFRGPTLPNHFFLILGQTPTSQNFDNFSINTRVTSASIFDELSAAHISWTYYAGPGQGFDNYNPVPYLASYWANYDLWNRCCLKGSDKFLSDLARGNLADVTWIMPEQDQLSDHPPYNLKTGQDYVQSLVSSLQQSEFWNSSVIFLTWDESGGFYDHVAPSSGYGFRVPLLVLSPHVRQGYIDHAFSSHSSILAFIESVFGLSCIARDCQAENLLELFNPSTNSTSSEVSKTASNGTAPQGLLSIVLITTLLIAGIAYAVIRKNKRRGKLSD